MVHFFSIFSLHPICLSVGCGGLSEMKNCSDQNGIWYNNTCHMTHNLTEELRQQIEMHGNESGEALKVRSPADEYFQ